MTVKMNLLSLTHLWWWDHKVTRSCTNVSMISFSRSVMCFCYTRPPAKLLFLTKALRVQSDWARDIVTLFDINTRLVYESESLTPRPGLRPSLSGNVFSLHSTYVIILRPSSSYVLLLLLLFFFSPLNLIIFIHYCCLITRYGLSCTFLQRQAGRERIPFKRWV